ncbi:hypothetical protein GQ53DRAFT_805199 [Thozetella sp. PMI_491]|nr:hypothetical protein GQ53DRAFT_805199 [Thozetella sp. PMI_491]
MALASLAPKAPLHSSGDVASSRFGGVERDPYDRLIGVCLESHRYPCNLLRKNIPKDVARRLWKYIEDHDRVLFRGDKARLVFWEHWNRDNIYHETDVSKLTDLKIHLDRRQEDPQCRHAYAYGSTSSAMLKYLMTYQQVDVSFLDSIFAFGDQEEPLDAGLSLFQYDNAWSQETRLPTLETIGRSGQEWRFSILLRTAERTSEAGWQWSMRQAALYHSFDVVTGKTLWISVKGNNLLEKRIKESTSDIVPAYTEPTDELLASLRAALDILVMLFTWCEENWRWCIRDIEDTIRDIMIKAKTAPIDKKPHFSRARPTTRSSGQISQPTGAGLISFLCEMPEKGFNALKPTRWRRRQITHVEAAPKSQQTAQHARASGARLEASEELVLEMFNYGDLQDLNVMGEKVEDAILIIKLNKALLVDTENFYLMLMDSTELPSDTVTVLHSAVPPFLKKTAAIVRRLETRQLQLESLYNKLNEGKTLFENLLQYRSLQVSRILAEHGNKSIKAMEKMAQKTVEETFSMHIVTILTLMFLPGTFIAMSAQANINCREDLVNNVY